jgi:integrase
VVFLAFDEGMTKSMLGFSRVRYHFGITGESMSRKPKKVSGVYERNPGSGVFHVQYRIPSPNGGRGRLIRKMVGTRQEAIDYLNKVKHIRASGSGVLPTTAKRPAVTFAEESAAQGSVLFGELCDELLKHIKDNPREYKDQRNPPQRIGRIKAAFGNRPAVSIKAFEVRQWLDSLDVLPATRNRYKAVFSAIFTHGKERDKVQSNPARDVKQARVNNGVIRYLTPEEEKRLRAVLQQDVNACGNRRPKQRNRMLHRIHELDLALLTGMRKGEQYSLRWPDVNLDRGELIARDTKNGTDRVVILTPSGVRSLTDLKALPLHRKRRAKDRPNNAPEDVVFAIGDSKKWFGSALRKAHIKHFRWHDLRHTFCSRLAQSGASLKVIQEAAGHKTIAMSVRYAHMNQTTIRAALEALDRMAAD